MQTKYLFILNANIKSNYLARQNLNAYNDISIIVTENSTQPPIFEYSSYNINILDTTPIGTTVLSMRYIANPTDDIVYSIKEISNVQINSYFDLKISTMLQTIYLVTKTSPIISDKPNLSFLCSIRSLNSLIANITSTSIININILNSVTASNYPKFQQPLIPNEQIYVDLLTISNNSVVYQLQASNANTQSNTQYRIVNQLQSSVFYIDSNLIRIVLPISTTDQRSNFLVNIST